MAATGKGKIEIVVRIKRKQGKKTKSGKTLLAFQIKVKIVSNNVSLPS